MADSFYVLHKVMRSAYLYLAFNDLGDIPAANVYEGLNNTERKLPSVITFCTSLELASDESGAHEGIMTIQVRSDSDQTTVDEHHTRAETVFNLLADGLLESNMSAELDNFTCFEAKLRGQRFSVDDPHWVSEVDVQILVAGSDIT